MNETYVYILLSKKDGNCYVGLSSNLLRRFWQHSNGLVASTKNRRPLIMVHWEIYPDKGSAQRRESWLKSPEYSEFKTNLRRLYGT